MELRGRGRGRDSRGEGLDKKNANRKNKSKESKKNASFVSAVRVCEAGGFEYFFLVCGPAASLGHVSHMFFNGASHLRSRFRN